MVDNTTLNTGSGGDVIATDDVTTLNGGASSGVKVQRIKVGYGPDASYTDVSSSSPMPSVIVPEGNATFRGRATTFRVPGRAGTTGQKILALHNATGSTKVVHVNQITVDLSQTVIKAITVIPPIIRVHRFTAVPTSGTTITKVAKDSTLTSSASVTAWNDASVDGTSSGTALTVTLPGTVIAQEFAPRFISNTGYEMFDRTTFLDGYDVVLRALEGICVFLDYTLATANPTTDMWIATIDWYEV